MKKDLDPQASPSGGEDPATEPKANRCWCGGAVCVCNVGGFWRAHCQDCDWSFGGSSLSINRDRSAVIREWNSRVPPARPRAPEPSQAKGTP